MVKKNLAKEKTRMKKVLRILKNTYPEAKCSLTYQNPFELLCATILSAQCTDERVNKVTLVLFRRFNGPKEMAEASLSEIEEIIRSTGFFKNKARSLKECSRGIVEKHGSKVPMTMEELIHLRGVGRKTANVVLGNAFGVPGLVVDTHVGRISRRLGFTQAADPAKVEHDLMPVVPKNEWTLYSHLLIHHGREICTARIAKCEICPITGICPKIGVAKKGVKRA